MKAKLCFFTLTACLFFSCSGKERPWEQYYLAEDWDFLVDLFQKKSRENKSITDEEKIYAAWAYTRIGEPKIGKRILQEITNFQIPLSWETKMLFSRMLLYQESYDKVISLFGKKSRLSPEHLLLARAHYEKGDVERSLALLDKLREEFPEYTEINTYYEAIRLLTFENEK